MIVVYKSRIIKDDNYTLNNYHISNCDNIIILLYLCYVDNWLLSKICFLNKKHILKTIIKIIN